MHGHPERSWHLHPLRTAMRRLGGLIVAVGLWLGWLPPAGAASTILCNAFSFSMLDLAEEGTVRYSPMTLADAKSHFSNFRLLDSAVGHEATAAMLTGLLGQPVHFNRQSVKLEKGQDMVLFQWKGARLPEGKVLLADEIRLEDFQFVRISIR